MVDLKAKQKYIYFNYVKHLIKWFVNLPIAIFGIVMLFICVVDNNSILSLPTKILMILLIISMTVQAILILIESIYLNKLRMLTVKQFYEIISSTQISGNSKVVYVYTCHNDLNESRVLQNSQQTYKNIEVWISDGSDDDKVSYNISRFAKQHNFHYFKVGSNGSKNKSENLNTFLTKTGVVFDYLLITDSDEALDSHFVEYAIKCFNSRNFKNLGFVTPLNYYYNGSSLYTNAMLNQVNVFCWKSDFGKTLTFNNMPNLYSASCLISKDLLVKNDNLFPAGCLEDYFLEQKAISMGFSSIILPISPCGQEFDKSIFATLNRNFRIFDWQIYLYKTNVFKTYNEKYSSWYGTLSTVVFSVPLSIFGLILLPWILWIIIWNGRLLFTNPWFIALLSSGVFLLIIFLISLKIGISKKTVLNEYGHLSWIFGVLYGLGCLGHLIKHWFNAVFKNKYSDFVSSGNFQKDKKRWPYVVVLCVSSLVLLSSIFIFTFCKLFAHKWLLILFLYMLVISLVPLLSSLSMLILIWASHKIICQYDENAFVYPKKFYKFEHIKNQFKGKKEEAHDSTKC